MNTEGDHLFYYNGRLVDSVPVEAETIPGNEGKFIVTRFGRRPRMTSEIARQRAVSSGTDKQVDLVEFLRSIR